MATKRFLGWIALRWTNYRFRKRMRSSACLLVKSREIKPEVLRYLESLEFRVEKQDRELRMLRWSMEGELMANWDREQDIREKRNRREGDSLREEYGGLTSPSPDDAV